MNKKQDALAVARDITEEFEGRKPLRPANWKEYQNTFWMFCPACGMNRVWHERARFCRGKKPPWWWPWGARCDEDRPHLHVSCKSCKWDGIVAPHSDDA